jgi:hypothetical protein
VGALHRGDAEPPPKAAGVLAAWTAFHAGRFGDAVEAGTAGGRRGAQRGREGAGRLRELPREERQGEDRVARGGRGLGRRASQGGSKDANAHYLYAFALGRWGQGISVAKALTQGFGGKIKDALTTAIKLEPRHADAHIAYGAYQAEVIDKVGGIVAGVTYGAKKDSAIEHFERALELNPDSAIARIEFANGL